MIVNKIPPDKRTDQPKVEFKNYEWKAFHGNKFAFITLNDTNVAREKQANAPKFSVYVGNGFEPSKSLDEKQLANFDPKNTDQKTIAAQFHVTSLTDVSLKNLSSTAKEPSRNRSAIKGRADVVEFSGNDVIILNANDVSRTSSGKRLNNPSGVHIYTGDRNSFTAKQSQPMVLGNSLNDVITDIKESLDQTNKEIMNINITILKMKIALVAHFHPPLGLVPSPTLAAQFIPEMAVSDIKRLLNNVIDIINGIFEEINSLPISKSTKNFLSQYNTVN